jgi:uncharacterized protein (TIGR02266 family)
MHHSWIPRQKRIPVYVRAHVSGLEPIAHAYTANLSEGGIYLKTREARTEVPIGTQLTVEFRLPRGGPELRMVGTIVWTAANVRDHLGRHALGMGLRFEAGQLDARQHIRHFVRSFRYQAVLLDFPEPELAKAALSDLYELVTVANEATLWEAAATGQVGLILTGEEPGKPQQPPRVTRLLGADVEQLPPIVFAATEPNLEVAVAIDHSDRVVFRRPPMDRLELRSLGRRLVDAHVLAYENDRLTGELEAAIDRLRRENRYLRQRVAEPSRLEGMLGEAEAMRRVFELIERVAPLNTSVLIEGETGTGKDLAARAVHALSPRAEKPFLVQNCAALPETLLDGELFGHVRGAFTGATSDRAGLFEAANGGTVFLDEVGEMTASMQGKLLRVLANGEIRRVGSTKVTHVDVRVVCATHRDLEAMVKAETFRQDLFYRLRTFVIPLPPLRERRADIAAMALHFLDIYAERHKHPVPGFTPEAISVLESHGWPGNVRELEHAIEHMLILAPEGKKIDAPLVRDTLGIAASATGEPKERGLDEVLNDYERQLIQAELERAGGVLAKAARTLGVDRTTLSKRCKRLGLRTTGN